MKAVTTETTGGALEGVWVVELTRTPAGEFAAGVLADMGANVVKVEPPEGSPTRRRGPAIPGEEDALSFQAENRGKRSIVASLDALGQASWFRELVEAADALVEDFGPGELEASHLGPARLWSWNPRLSVLRLSPYGQTGPLASAPGDDRTAQAFAGGQFLTGFPDRPPHPVTVPMADSWSGILGATGLLSCVLEARRSGHGDIVDLGLHEALLRTMGGPLAAYSHDGTVTMRQGNFAMGVVPGNIFETSDGGFVALSGAGDKPFVRLCEAIEAPEAATDPRFSTTSERRKHRDEADALVAGWISQHTLLEVETRFTDMGVAGAVVRSADQIVGEPHVEERGVLAPMTSSSGVPFRAPAHVPRFWRTPANLATAAPRPGEHNAFVDDIVAAAREHPKIAAVHGSAPTVSGGPLDGFRVADISQVLAGPFGAGLLADLGAEVVMVELPEAESVRSRFASGERLGFLATNRNKASVTLDMRTPDGRAALLDLVRVSDALVENYRPGTLERWGLGPDVLLGTNPGLVIVRASGFGQSGPYSARSSYNPVACAFGGVTYLGGWPDRPPLRDGITAGDYVTALFAALGAVAGLVRRDLDGEGQIVDVAMYEAALRMTGDLIPLKTALGIRRERAAGAWATYPLSLTFEAADGRWVEVSPDSWLEVATLTGSHGADEAGARASAAAFIRGRTAADAVGELEAAGGRASVVNSTAELVETPHLWERGDLVRLESPEFGSVVVPGVVPAFARRRARIATWSRARGSDNDAILGGLLGYDAARIADVTSAAAG